MGLSPLQILNLLWNQGKKSMFIRLNVPLVLHALHVQNSCGDHVLDNILELRGWLAYAWNRFNVSACNIYLLTFHQWGNLYHFSLILSSKFPFLFFAPLLRWYAQIERSFPVTTCVEIFYLVVIITALTLAMPWRLSLVKSVLFLAKRCQNFLLVFSSPCGLLSLSSTNMLLMLAVDNWIMQFFLTAFLFMPLTHYFLWS